MTGPIASAAGTGLQNFFLERVPYTSGQFSDVDENLWYGGNRQQSISTAVRLGIVVGRGDGTFDPTGSLTVAEAVKMACVVHDIYGGGSGTFTQGEPWYQVYVDYAAANGLITASQFPDYGAPCTRAEMAGLFAHAIPSSEFSSINTVNSLPDVNANTPYSSEIFMLYRAGVLTGSDVDGTFHPDSNITRAEACALIVREVWPSMRQKHTLGAVDIALITDGGGVDDHSYNQALWEGITQYTFMFVATIQYFRPVEDSDQARVQAMEAAISQGAKVIVVSGYLFAEAVVQEAAAHPDVMFLGIDMTDDAVAGTGNGDIADPAPNVALIKFREEQAGYLAGYAAVMDGYTKLGFIGGIAVPAVIRYGYGYIQGADQAANDMGLAKGAVTMNYWYANTFAPSDDVLNTANAWYTAGTQVIFSCGGGIDSSVLGAAESQGTKVILEDVDQSYLSPCVLTSAMKDLGGAVTVALMEFYGNGGETWPSWYAGQCQNWGVERGDMVGLPTTADAWRFATYTVADYESLCDKLGWDTIIVDDSSDFNVIPTTSDVTVNYIS